MMSLKWFKENLFTLGCCIFLFFLLGKMDDISTTITTFVEPKDVKPPITSSIYKKEENFLFVQNATSFSPLSPQDLKNIFFTIVNSGWESFTFYCPNEYQDCVEDMKKMSQDQILLTHINNYVHPYYNFSNIRTSLSESGEVSIYVEYLYQEDQIKVINEQIDSYIQDNVSEDMDLYDKIKLFHDYIIDHTKYDVTRNEEGESNYLSYLAYGPLMEGYATCNGYTDVMAIFLSKLGVKNYKIATTPEENDTSNGHVWNAVYLNEEWLHLDLTWDDPVSADGKDYLQHKYFLVNNAGLRKADEGEVEVLEHQYDPSIYLEFQREKKNDSIR